MKATAFIIGPADGPGAALADMAKSLGFQSVLPYGGIVRAEQQAMSAPFLIEDEQVVRQIARLADATGTAMAEVVRLAIADYHRRYEISESAPDWLQKFWHEHPLPLPTGFKADKRFYDALSGDS